jgi:hypothetical protein
MWWRQREIIDRRLNTSRHVSEDTCAASRTASRYILSVNEINETRYSATQAEGRGPKQLVKCSQTDTKGKAKRVNAAAWPNFTTIPRWSRGVAKRSNLVGQRHPRNQGTVKRPAYASDHNVPGIILLLIYTMLVVEPQKKNLI